MIVNYSDKPVIEGNKSIFLAGPTPRDNSILSWRKLAIKLLEEKGFDGVVYVPERENDDHNYDLDTQAGWEREALFGATVILFWVPRKIKGMPGFTTNVEFGYWMAKNPDKVVFGRPYNAEKCGYLDWLFELETNREQFDTMESTINAAIKRVNELSKGGDDNEVEWS